MVNAKLDGPLAARARELEELTGEALESARRRRVVVLAHVVGDLDNLEQAGFWTQESYGEIVVGTVAVEDLDTVAELADVAALQSNRRSSLALHESVPDIQADVVHASPLGYTGAGVIVGIVDTGIDIFHEAFRHESGDTRIVSLLDTTLQQAIAVYGKPSSGSFRLTWLPPQLPDEPPPQEQSTAFELPLSANDITLGMLGWTPLRESDFSVTGGPIGLTSTDDENPIVVDFHGRLDSRYFDSRKINPLEIKDDNLTDGTKPKIEVIRGREFFPDEINNALHGDGEPFASRDLSGHGTHVAGIAAGDGSQAGTVAEDNCTTAGYYVGVAPKAELVIVRTTMDVVENIRGVRHIFNRAASAGKPAVVNLSFGSQYGPHDGTDAEEKALDIMLQESSDYGRAIVIAAGNEGDAGLHASGTVAANGSRTFTLCVEAKTNNACTFNLWYAGAGKLNLTVRMPLADDSLATSGIVVAGQAFPSHTWKDHVLEAESTLNNLPSGRHNIEFTIVPPAERALLPGEWKITLTETAGHDVTVDCWIIAKKGKVTPRFVEADRDRSRTISTPGTAKLPITVGAYRVDENGYTLAKFSSRGPTTDATRPDGKPDLCAPGVGIVSVKSEARNTGCCCDCCNDFYVPDSGTSMAAPHVTGVVALMFQKNAKLTHAEVKSFLRAHGRSPVAGATEPPAPFEWGVGMVDALAVVDDVPAGVQAADNVPRVARASEHVPLRERLRDLRRWVAEYPAAELAATLVSAHVDEVQRLIETDRRVLVAWHRLRGRELLDEIERTRALPATIGDRSLADGLARLLDELARASSPELRADVERHRAFVLSLPGTALSDLDREREVD
ncbi:S8 family serine peptidase [Actinosynnema sp. NPDC050801]|uniref:S8 family serine peptidase n=1 Tax=unclassified Actinosynnema TaxID=2637065 RepID=UPI0033E530C3